MANLAETATYEDGIYQLELTDDVIAGADGISNRQAAQLANRTKYLKETGNDTLSVFADTDTLEATYPPAVGYRGKMALVSGGVGGDQLYICKLAADGATYQWTNIPGL